jgi:DNA-binding transcriptional LysR family regulator
MPPLDRVARRIKLHDLDVLMTVVEAGSMGKAAAQLNKTQPSISRAIADLERVLGVRLVDRNRQGVGATSYGRALLDCSTAIFDELSQGIKNVKYLANPTEGELWVGTDSPGAAGILPEAIVRFRRQYPRIDIHVQHMSEVSQQNSALRQRACDFFLGRLAQTTERDFETEILYQEEVVAVAGSHHPLARRRKIALSELVDHRWTLPTAGSVVGDVITRSLRASGPEFPIKGVVTGPIHMHSILVAGGDFLGFVSGSFLHFGAKGLGLKILPVKLQVPPTPFGVIRLRNRSVGPIAPLFVGFLRETAREFAKRKT